MDSPNGRYHLSREIAAGGMARVHLARLLGKAGFSRTVAVKRLHPTYVRDEEFRRSFLDEARLASRIRHPNVVATLDVETVDDEILLVLEYVHGEALSRLVRHNGPVDARIAVRILVDALEGLHAAHEARDERGQPLGIVHRDVSPQNILVGVDGVARVFDFGIARSMNRLQNTADGNIKGKLPYMSPEQVLGEPLDHRTDIFAAGIVLWETLVGERLFKSAEDVATLVSVVSREAPDPSARVSGVPPELGEVVLKALAKKRSDRFASAKEMAEALERALAPAPARAVGGWVRALAAESLAEKERFIADLEGELVAAGPVPAPTPGVALANAPGESASSAAESTGTSRAVIATEARRGAAPRGGTARRLAFGLVAVALLASAAALALVVTRRGAAGPSAPSRTTGSNPAGATTSAVTAASNASPTTSTADEAPRDARLGTAPEAQSAAAAPPPSATTPRPSASARTVRPSVRQTPPPAPSPAAPTTVASPDDDCDNPFAVGPDGIRRPKLHCLRR